jgi:Fe-S-cluster containining protein
MSPADPHSPSPVELYEQLPFAQQRCLDEINFLASELRDHLLPEQFMLTVNAINQRLQTMHPQIPCQSGCSRCCQNHLEPTLTHTEWEWVQEALAGLSEAVQRQIKAQVHAKSKGESRACPLLIEGRCSIYSVRPLDCRLQGYSLSNSSPFTCQEERLRMSHELEQQTNPLGYMFMPQRDRLKMVFSSVTSQKEPLQTLFSLLKRHLHNLP